jgi:hypothetical protein
MGKRRELPDRARARRPRSAGGEESSTKDDHDDEHENGEEARIA